MNYGGMNVLNYTDEELVSEALQSDNALAYGLAVKYDEMFTGWQKSMNERNDEVDNLKDFIHEVQKGYVSDADMVAFEELMFKHGIYL